MEREERARWTTAPDALRWSLQCERLFFGADVLSLILAAYGVHAPGL
jgi:hypothetical protein